jgi:hypothetical protein
MNNKFLKMTVAGLAMSAGCLVSLAAAQASVLKVAVWEDSFKSSTTVAAVNAAPLKAFLEDGDNYDFEVTFVSQLDVEAGLLSAGSFDTFLVGGRQHVSWSDTMAEKTSDFVLNGGGYVGMGWGVTYSTSQLSATGYGYLRDFQPTTQTNNIYVNSSGAIAIIDLTHPIVQGLFDYTPAQTSCCSMITPNGWGARVGATVVATNNGNNLIIADESGLGRGVYMGVNIGSYNIYSDQVDANTELLLENALAWSAGAKAIDVPEPSTLAILGLGFMGLVARRFNKHAL